jgi:hypothetical protein
MHDGSSRLNVKALFHIHVDQLENAAGDSDVHEVVFLPENEFVRLCSNDINKLVH